MKRNTEEGSMLILAFPNGSTHPANPPTLAPINPVTPEQGPGHPGRLPMVPGSIQSNPRPGHPTTGHIPQQA